MYSSVETLKRKRCCVHVVPRCVRPCADPPMLAYEGSARGGCWATRPRGEVLPGRGHSSTYRGFFTIPGVVGGQTPAGLERESHADDHRAPAARRARPGWQLTGLWVRGR